MTEDISLRSRVKGNVHARFCSRGRGSDSLVDCNRTGEQWWFAAQWSIQKSGVDQPLPLSVGRWAAKWLCTIR
jgi:hypothetical protein